MRVQCLEFTNEFKEFTNLYNFKKVPSNSPPLEGLGEAKIIQCCSIVIPGLV